MRKNAKLFILLLAPIIVLTTFCVRNSNKKEHFLSYNIKVTEFDGKSGRLKSQDIIVDNIKNKNDATQLYNQNDSNVEEIERQTNTLLAYYSELQLSNDPLEKRSLRESISNLNPVSDTFIFFVDKLSKTKDLNQKLQIYSILTLINSASIVEEVKHTASSTSDVELFVSLAYSLGNAQTIDSKKALIELLRHNSFPVDKEPNSPLGNLALKALYRVLMNILSEEDLLWLNTYLENRELSTEQEYVILQFIEKIDSVSNKVISEPF